jgi:hypothetical protein
MSFAAITLCVASQRVFIIVVYFIIDSVRKLLDIPSHRPALMPAYPMGTGTLALRVKRPSCEADHSPPSIAERLGMRGVYLHSAICLCDVVFR